VLHQDWQVVRASLQASPQQSLSAVPYGQHDGSFMYTMLLLLLYPQAPTFSDLELLYPSLYSGLQQLLDFEGDVEATFCRWVCACLLDP
jgi:hypothetical protein